MDDEFNAAVAAWDAMLDRRVREIKEELRAMNEGVTACIERGRARLANVDRAQVIADWQREQASKNA